MEKMMRCAIYTRVSTDNQAEVEFNSCEAQEDRIRSFIDSQETMDVFKVYTDPGYSGSNLERPAIREMLKDIQSGKVELVISYKIDRLTRSPRDFYQLIELFEKNEVNFISVTERFDTSTPSGRLLRNIMLTFAQFERELTSERTKDKLQQRAMKGMWNGGIPPFGYKRVDKKLVPDEKEADIVKRIFEIYVSTGSTAETYNMLKKEGIFGRNGELFTKTSIRRMVSNEVYAGKTKHQGKIYPGLHQAITSEEMFDLAQKIKRDKEERVKRGMSITYPFAGLITCKECGSMMTPSFTNKGSNRRYYYYRCTCTFKHDWEKCGTRQVSANRLERYILERLKSISADNGYIESLLFKLNYDQAGGRTGLELTTPCSDFRPFNAEKFKLLTSSFWQKAETIKQEEKTEFFRNFFDGICYSKDGIELRIKYPCSDRQNRQGETGESAVRSGGRTAAPAGASVALGSGNATSEAKSIAEVQGARRKLAPGRPRQRGYSFSCLSFYQIRSLRSNRAHDVLR